MKHLLLATLMALCSVAVMAAEPDWAIHSEKASQALLLDVVHAGNRLVVVGDRGHILTSDDQGQTWNQARVPTRQLLTAVYFVDAEHGWAVGHDAQILASSDGGQTWRQQYQNLESQAPLLDVWFLDRQRGFVVGAYGAFLATEDGGEHWQDISERLDNSEQLHLNAIAAIKDAGLFIVGEQGHMYRSADAGQSWQAVASPYDGSLLGVTATGQPGTLLVYGLRGHLLRSADFGQTWQSVCLPSGMQDGLAGASLLADGSLVVVGNGGSVLRSRDQGQSFTLVNRADRLALSAVTQGAPGRLLMVGQGGVHIGAADGGPVVVQP
ncbi:YCF48-related protein [Pseudomonas sp. HR96]|uniref:WD40/YVTN/BNR-like repeat-containing protein n=1 Tax=Pseudomonas sp. HR96 TaxID=1027966 RepID=UPI002A755D4E|nr:YCF48-related protein [Pseudomonas sp. HR96]WPO98666.1 YCF48-related protein [Pseudomonas sp. HR96]